MEQPEHLIAIASKNDLELLQANDRTKAKLKERAGDIKCYARDILFHWMKETNGAVTPQVIEKRVEMAFKVAICFFETYEETLNPELFE